MQAQGLAKKLLDKIDMLASFPRLGKVYNFLTSQPKSFDDAETRELIVSYGKGGYRILYTYFAQAGNVVILSIKHSRERHDNTIEMSDHQDS